VSIASSPSLAGTFWETATHIFSMLLVMLGILPIAPMFAAKVVGQPKRIANKLAWRIVRACTVSLLIGTIVGPYILKLTLLPSTAFSIVGSIAFLETGGKMFFAKYVPEEPPSSVQPESKLAELMAWTIVPAAFPLTAGAGVNSALIAEMSTFTVWVQYLSLTAASAATLFVLWCTLRFLPARISKLHHRTRFVIDKVNGALLLAIGVYLGLVNGTVLVIATVRQQGLL
jgi:small neutral amino acid transporter SnatA (MarC family)